MRNSVAHKNSHIILIGYMGCGKTVVGKLLSKKLNLNWIDLDQVIELKENMKISKIFKTKGELGFRKIENKVLTEILRKSNKHVISLGGGTPCYYNNMNLITENSKNVFYLKNSVKTLSKRLLNEKKDRPILSEFKTLNKIEEFVSKHLFERMFFYNKASHIIDSEKWGVKKNVYEIIKILNQ